MKEFLCVCGVFFLFALLAFGGAAVSDYRNVAISLEQGMVLDCKGATYVDLGRRPFDFRCAITKGWTVEGQQKLICEKKFCRTGGSKCLKKNKEKIKRCIDFRKPGEE